MEKIWDWLKEHPVILIAGVIIGGLGLMMLLSGGGSSSAAPGTNQLSLQQDAEAAQAQAQQSNQSFQLAAQAQNYSGQLALAQETDQTQLAEATLNAAVTNNQNQWNYQTAIAAISAQLAGLESNNATSVDIANIAANENLGIAQINSNTLLGVSANQTKVAIEQVKATEQAGTNSLIGGILGSLF